MFSKEIEFLHYTLSTVASSHRAGIAHSHHISNSHGALQSVHDVHDGHDHDVYTRHDVVEHELDSGPLLSRQPALLSLLEISLPCKLGKAYRSALLLHMERAFPRCTELF